MYPKPVITRSWLVSPGGPRTGMTPDQVRTFQLGNKGAPGNVPGPYDPQLSLPAPDVPIYATLVTPDGSEYRSIALALVQLVAGSAAQSVTASFPDDFPGAPRVLSMPGVYTIIWTTTRGYLACDAFRLVAG